MFIKIDNQQLDKLLTIPNNIPFEHQFTKDVIDIIYKHIIMQNLLSYGQEFCLEVKINNAKNVYLFFEKYFCKYTETAKFKTHICEQPFIINQNLDKKHTYCSELINNIKNSLKQELYIPLIKHIGECFDFNTWECFDIACYGSDGHLRHFYILNDKDENFCKKITKTADESFGNCFDIMIDKSQYYIEIIDNYIMFSACYRPKHRQALTHMFQEYSKFLQGQENLWEEIKKIIDN